MSPEVKARIREEKLAQRFAFEEKRKGDWELLFPAPTEKRQNEYSNMLKLANEIWDDFTTGKGKKDPNRGTQGSKMSNGKPGMPAKAGQQSMTNISAAKGQMQNKLSTEKK